MLENISELCERYINVRDIIKENFVWDDTYIHPAAAMTFYSRGILPDPDKMRECRKMLKKNTSLMSYFRGSAELLMISEMSASPDPHDYLDKVLSAYDKLKKAFPTCGRNRCPSSRMNTRKT